MKVDSKYKIFHPWKCIWKRRLRNGGHFVQEEMSLNIPHPWLEVYILYATWLVPHVRNNLTPLYQTSQMVFDFDIE